MKKWTRRRFLVNGVRASVLVVVGKGVFNTTPRQIEVVKREVRLKGLPATLRGFKVALLSDLHASDIVSDELIGTAADLAMKEKPDMIALTGDFVSGPTKFLNGSIGGFKKKNLDSCIDAMMKLKAPYGVYGVLGNHDFWCGPEAMKTIMDEFSNRLAVAWLRNSSVTLEKDGGKLDILGVDDYWENSCSLNRAYDGLDSKNIKVLLSHNPDVNEMIDVEKKRIDLVLSGHTHGGQVVFPLIGVPYMPSKYGTKYAEGLVRDGERQTYISRGVGHLMVPVRINCPPEVSILTLV